MTTMQQMVRDFFRNNNINQIMTFLMIATGLYVAIISITGQNFLRPLASVTSNTLDLTRAADEILHSVISSFILIVFAFAAGKTVKFFYFPSLVGCMLVGIALKNIPQINGLLYINSYWQFCLRKLGLVVIIIRWGLSINCRFIKENVPFTPVFGIGSASCEAIGIFAAAYFLFQFPAPLAIMCGFVVGTVSPAVCMPTLLNLKNKGIGNEKSIADTVAASCCFDNVFSLLIFSSTAAATFTHDASIPTLVKNIGAIVLAILIGCSIGWIIRWFPKNDVKHTNTARFLIITSTSFGVITSMLELGYQFPGICATLAVCCVSATHWRTDNPRGITVLLHQYDNVWNFVAVPVLFSLVGYTFDLSELSSSDVKTAFSIIAIGSTCRMISSLIIGYSGRFNVYEQIILTLSTMPKATVQCALAPSLLLLVDEFPELKEKTKLIVNICIIAVIITSSVVEILLDILAPRFLKKRSSIYNSDPIVITNKMLTNDDYDQRKQAANSSGLQANSKIYEINPNFVPINFHNPSTVYSRPYYHANNNNIVYNN